MNAIVFASSVDRKGKHDATGAFIPEARKFARYHSLPRSSVHLIDCINNTAIKRRRIIQDILRGVKEPLDLMAFFCHGWSTGIQLGFSTVNTDAMLRYAPLKNDAKIVLYACSAAQEFAPKLADSMSDKGCLKGWIDAHDRKGHTTENPYVRRIFVTEKGKNTDGWIVDPSYEKWPKWKSALKGNMRFMFPITERELI